MRIFPVVVGFSLPRCRKLEPITPHFSRYVRILVPWGLTGGDAVSMVVLYRASYVEGKKDDPAFPA